MTEQLAFTLAAAAVGFVAAVFFCIGNVLNTSASIVEQATPYWDFSEPVAQSLVAQRVQHLVGAFLLIVAFVLQIVATLSSSTEIAPLPSALADWRPFLITTLVVAGIVAGLAARLLRLATLRRVLALARPEK